MENDFLFVQNLIDTLCGLEVHLVPNSRDGFLSLMSESLQGVLPQLQVDVLIRHALRAVEPGRAYHWASPIGLRYSLYCRAETGQLLLLGPCRDEVFPEKEVTAYLRTLRLAPDDIQRLLSFCRLQPVFPYDRLYNLCQLLARELSGPGYPLSQENLLLGWTEQEQKQLLEGSDFTELDRIRSVEGRYEASAVITEAVKQGNLSLAFRYIQKMGTIPQDLVRSESSLRNVQNLCIIMNTQLRYAMELDGVHPYRLDQISGGIARQIEKLKSTSAAYNFFPQILRQYCELAQEQRYRGLAPFARLAVAYIHSHLSDNLSVKSAAKALLVNADYLSARFHREVGVAFIQYVNQERCRQAAGLLERTTLQIQQVAGAVGYNNTSYFARQFALFYGCTPGAYRAKN